MESFQNVNKQLREALKSNPRSKQEISDHLARNGVFISARELQRIEDEAPVIDAPQASQLG